VKVFIQPLPGEGADPETGLPTALRLAMDSAGVGVWVLERRSGVSHQTIANLANGKGGIERRKAADIAAALGVPVTELFQHSVDPA
jgi:hypothetical protein